MTNRENEYENEQLSIDDDISQFWCRVIEGIVRDTVQKTIRSIQVEQYAEVVIKDVNITDGTVTCRNIQTDEIFHNVPNYSNFDLNSLIDEKGNTQWSNGRAARGRMFITNIKDNPYYLGIWYN